MKYLKILFFALSLFLVNCRSFEDIRIVRVVDVTYEELRGSTVRLAIRARVDNPNQFNIKIINSDLVLRVGEQVIGNITQMEQIELKGRTEQDYTIRVSVDIKDALSNMISLLRIFRGDQRDLNISGTVHAKSLFISKKVYIDRLSFQ